ncbi:MAG: 4Fe-4S dicluster domain-containing protein [Promethearchaeota archaeon]
MQSKIILKNELNQIIKKLMDYYTVIAPQKEKEFLKYGELANVEDIILDFPGPSKIPPKSILFPQKEILFTFELKNKNVKLSDSKTSTQEKPQILFGIRPCDTRSLALLKMFFEWGNYKDVYYSEKYNNSIFISYACNSPRSTCFCTSVNGGPFNKDNSDLLLVDIGKKYVLSSLTDKGDSVLEVLSELKDATNQDLEKVKRLEQEAKNSMKKVPNIDKINEDLEGMYDNEIWDTLSEVCLGCATCTFLCPTCHCFDVLDERLDEHHGARIRIWDTCQFPLFSKHGSGHNPRGTKSSRFRQRVFHKFSYYPINYGVLGCVGCGRCINYCPMHSDIREELTRIEEVKKNLHKNKEGT